MSPISFKKHHTSKNSITTPIYLVHSQMIRQTRLNLRN